MKCDHCQLDFPKNSLEEVKSNDKTLHFCCNGCKSVYFILEQNDLSDFYKLLGNKTLSPKKQPNQADLARFDSPAFSKFIHESDGIKQVSLIISGIHCSACIWLIEKMLMLNPSILEANMNYTNAKLKISFLSDTKLSKIIEIIQNIGYEANLYDPKISESLNEKESKKLLKALVVGIFCTMNIMWIAIAQYSGYFLGIDTLIKNALYIASFALASPVLFYTGRFFYINAFRNLKNRIIGMDLLVSVGAFLTYFYSIYAALTGQESYFEAVAMIITFVFAGKFFEGKIKKRAGDFLDHLNFLMPSEITLFRGKTRQKAPPEHVKIGSKIEVLPNEIIAIDGILESQSAILDAQNITGEFLSVPKKRGDKILSLSLNKSQSFIYKTTKSFSDSMFFKLINTLGDALTKKPKIQNLANLISQVFSKTVLLIALFGFVIWYFYTNNFAISLSVAISVIVISCPCALALATPIASVTGILGAYKKGIIFKEASFLEKLAKCDIVVFDKTGTLTNGRPKVVREIISRSDLESQESGLSALLSISNHPISKAILEHIKGQNQNKKSYDKIAFISSEEILGKGLRAKTKDHIFIGGSLEFLSENGVDVSAIDTEGKIVFGFGIDQELLAIFLLEDELKEGAVEFISDLNAKKRVILLSGDNVRSVNSIANELNIKEAHANLLPNQKLDFINQLDSKRVVMIGDGLNDALAMTKSAVAITLGQNEALKLSGDIIILKPEISAIKEAFAMADKTYKTIVQNIAFSILYNACVIPLALFGFVIPLFAALSMSLSSIIVALNSLRIVGFKKDSFSDT